MGSEEVCVEKIPNGTTKEVFTDLIFFTSLRFADLSWTSHVHARFTFMIDVVCVGGASIMPQQV